MSNAQNREDISPLNAGYLPRKPTFCIGLDFAWFGCSAND
jgi:hypothetical protein